MNTLALTCKGFPEAVVYTQESQAFHLIKHYTSEAVATIKTDVGVTLETQLDRVNITAEELCALLNGLYKAYTDVAKAVTDGFSGNMYNMCKNGVVPGEVQRRAAPRPRYNKPSNVRRKPDVYLDCDGFSMYFDMDAGEWFCPDHVPDSTPTIYTFKPVGDPDIPIKMSGDELLKMCEDFFSSFLPLGTEECQVLHTYMQTQAYL